MTSRFRKPFRRKKEKEDIVPQKTDRYGFQYVELVNKKGEKEIRLVHELVALTFIPNPDNLPEVRHKNGNIKDNRAENLEWCSKEDNTDRCEMEGD